MTQREMDLAASVQLVTERILLQMARFAHGLSRQRNLCLAGGVALNCVANGRILREGPFEEVWIQPAAGDAGGSLGAALFIWHQLLGHERSPKPGDSQHGSQLGPGYTNDQVRAYLDAVGATYREVPDESVLCRDVAELIARGNVVGWMQGRMEFGPRALGNRSILGDPRDPEMQSRMNLKIKFRESFRPFAPSVLQEHACDWFTLPPGTESPYMLLVENVAPAHRVSADEADGRAVGLDRLKVVRSDIPAVTHVDGSARLQTVDELRNRRYHQLLKAFYELTGCPVLINTSFNVRGEPIVCSPEDAYRCFQATNIDVLVINDFVLAKADQKDMPRHAVDEYLSTFELD